MSMDIAVYKLTGVLPLSHPVTENSRIIAVPEKSFHKIESILEELPFELKSEEGETYAILHILFEEEGYMRKPFRDMDDSDTSFDEAADFIANNFEDAATEIDRSLHPALSDSNYAVMGFEDLDFLDEIGQYSFDPEMWKSNITDVITNSTIVVLDW